MAKVIEVSNVNPSQLMTELIDAGLMVTVGFLDEYDPDVYIYNDVVVTVIEGETGVAEDVIKRHIPEPNPTYYTDEQILGQQMTERELEAMVQGQQITDMEIRLMMLEMGANPL